MKNAINFDIVVVAMDNEEVNSVNARELHDQLKVGKDFSNWIKDRIDQCQLIENVDYVLVRQNGRINSGRGGDRRSINYFLSIDAAKHLAMMERNEIGKQVRQWFIQAEKYARSLEVEEIAKAIGLRTAHALNLLLVEEGLVYKTSSSRSTKHLPTVKATDAGLMVLKHVEVDTKYGTTIYVPCPKLTTKGAYFCARLFGSLEGEF